MPTYSIIYQIINLYVFVSLSCTLEIMREHHVTLNLMTVNVPQTDWLVVVQF